eukprot:2484843-Heterocapsa_arctica.AAC.1
MKRKERSFRQETAWQAGCKTRADTLGLISTTLGTSERKGSEERLQLDRLSTLWVLSGRTAVAGNGDELCSRALCPAHCTA